MSNVHSRMSPRQKMINLMYIVLTAMLALNVSSDVLDGFTKVDDGLKTSNISINERNDIIFSTLNAAAIANPEKAGSQYATAVGIRNEASALYDKIDSLKKAIVISTDGKNGNLQEIKNRENLDAASIVMLNPLTNQGEKLRGQIDQFRNNVLNSVTDSLKHSSIMNMLSTSSARVNGSDVERSWESITFENQPVVAAITLLSKLQNDIIFSEGEALSGLLTSVDAGDLRVNELQAFVIPESKVVMQGSPYSAEIILAAVDTTARPDVYINGVKTEGRGQHYEFIPSASGTYSFSGYLEVPTGNGTMQKQPFSSEYTVIEPTATISATMMNVLYGGIDNPIEIAVPGVTSGALRATMNGGNIEKRGNGWIARTAPGVSEATINVSIDNNGRSRNVASHSFKVRALPDPTAYISLDGTNRLKGDKPISKNSLSEAKGLGASIDDGILDIDFKVTGFETVFFDSMGNAMLERSDGASFSQRQKDTFKRLSRGKRFFISRIKAVGPDGTERQLSPIEVTIN